MRQQNITKGLIGSRTCYNSYILNKYMKIEAKEDR